MTDKQVNKTTKALKLAGKALGCSQQHLDLHHPEWVITRQQNDKALAAIREVLAEQDKQEPVGYAAQSVIDWLSSEERTASAYSGINLYKNPTDNSTTPLYAAPVSAKREWVDLTYEEIEDAVGWTMTLGAVWDCHAAIDAWKAKNGIN